VGLFKPNVKKLKHKRDIMGLIKTLSYEKDWEVRRAAAEALGELNDSLAVEPLIKALGTWFEVDVNEHYKVRIAAIKSLGKLNAIEPLIDALRDISGYLRAEAAEALGRLNDPRAVGPLIKALEDEDKDVRKAVTMALSKLSPGIEKRHNYFDIERMRRLYAEYYKIY
jgi:HEAT repeat protein